MEMSQAPREDLIRLIKAGKAQAPRLTLLNDLFDRQKSFVLDPSKRKAALCGRRAGKSKSVANYLIKELLGPGDADCAYIGLTRGSAKKIMFNPIITLNKKFKLGLHVDRTELTFTSPEGRTLYVGGAHTEDETEKLRGLKFKLVVLDECASFKAHLNYLIEEVLEPTLVDTDGTLALIGTPSANPGASYFHTATTDPNQMFSVHKWTIMDNPFIPHARRWLDDYKHRKGWGDDNPIYRREWLGEWTTDGSTLVYRYDRHKNDYSSMDSVKWKHVVGVDIGTVDYFALNVWAYSDHSPNLYSVYQFKRSGWYMEDWANKMLEVMDIYKPGSIVADHGALGKAICEDIRRRYGIPLKPAEKAQKWGAIDQLNSDLHTGRIKIKYGSELQKEMAMLQRDPDRDNKEDARTPNDLCDAALYGYREARHYWGSTLEPEPEMYSDAWLKREEKRQEELDLEAYKKSKEDSLLIG